MSQTPGPTPQTFAPKWRQRADGGGRELTPETILEAWKRTISETQTLMEMHEAQSREGREAMYRAFRCGVRACEMIERATMAEITKGGAS